MVYVEYNIIPSSSEYTVSFVIVYAPVNVCPAHHPDTVGAKVGI